MLSLALSALVVGTLCWPAGPGRHRLAQPCGGIRRAAVRLAARWGWRGWGLLLGAAAVGTGALWAGPAGGLAAALVTATAIVRWRATQRQRASATALTGLCDALGVLVAELRVGSHPGDALAAASTLHASGAPDALDELRRTFRAAAATARLGGEVPAVLRATASAPLRAPLTRLAQAWALAGRYGIPLAELLETVREDAEHRLRLAADLHARLAGPRATTVVLAGLPLLAVALGHAMGAAPLALLRHTPMGQALLVIGSGLGCAGVLWSAQLISRVVPS